ncbi:MAG: alkaline phosphatase family protein [Gaiellaceae bacterium]
MRRGAWKTAVAVLVLAVAAVVSVSLAQGSGKTTLTAAQRADRGPSVGDVKHVFVIVLENHSEAGVVGDPNAPYITSLAHTYAQATSYYGVTHPSEPNYVAMISGSNWWKNDDNPANRFDHLNLVDQLEAAHKSWGAYMEALPAGDKLADYWPSSSNALYASKHNPFVLFDDIRNSPRRLENVKPYTALAGDLQHGNSAPDFAFIVPDQCNDMHGGVYTPVAGHPETPCPYGSTNDDANDAALKQKADAFVHGAVQTITKSRSWKEGKSAIFIVSDEGDYTGNMVNGGWDSPAGCCDSPVLPAGDTDISSAWPGGVYGGGLVPAIVIVNQGGKSHGYASSAPYNHYSLLATIETIWKLDLIGYASDTAQVAPMTEFLTR